MDDSYNTIDGVSQSYINNKRSKFYGFAHHISTPNEAITIISDYKSKFFDAKHVCWAYRLGPNGDNYRINDDGEPSGTAGRPILGQIVSYNLYDVLVVVVRYFGGVKLGTSGLIETYKEASKMSLEQAYKRTVMIFSYYRVEYDYTLVGEVMRCIKDFGANIISQNFIENCLLDISIRQSLSIQIRNKLESIYGVFVEDLSL